jgi:hypothetical protein
MVPESAQDGGIVSPRHSKIRNDDGGRGIRDVAPVYVSDLKEERRAVRDVQNEIAVTAESGGDELSHFCIVLCQEYSDRGRGAPILSGLVVHRYLSVSCAPRAFP